VESAKSEDFRKAQEAAYRLLSYKPRSRRELILRLEAKGFPENIIEELINKLEAQKYLDDESFGQAVARSLIRRKFLGKDALMAELLKKGLDRKLAERITGDSYSENNEEELAMQALEKKLKGLRERPVEIARRKASDYLRRKGFPFSIIGKVLNEKIGIRRD
jgi:regulatory protein